MSDDEKRCLELSFGALVPPISEQVEAQGLGLGAEASDYWQALAEAVVRLSLRGLLTDKERRVVERRLASRIAAEVHVLPAAAGSSGPAAGGEGE